jgi:phage-related protein
MTTPTLGNGDFIITANSTDFERARADIFGVMRQIDRRADETADLIDRRFTQAADDITRQFDVLGVSIERSITQAAENSTREVQEMGRQIEASIDRSAAGLSDAFGRELAELRADMQRTANAVESDADRAGDAIAREIARGVALANAALALLGDGADRALGRIGGLVSGFAKLTAATAALSAGLAGLVQIMAGVVASMEQLAGVAFLAPAAIVAFVGILGTLAVALNGVGDALSAGLSGDVEKFNKALEELSPAARNAVAGLAPVIERMRELGDTVQDKFFLALGNELAEFGRVAVGVAERVMPALSTSLGQVTRSFLEAAQSTRFLSGIETILKRTAAGVSTLQGPVARLTDAFGDLFVVGAGYVDGFYASLGKVIDRFATWITVSSDNGNLKEWIDEALAGFRQVGRILGNLGSIFSELTSNASAAGTGILQILEDITDAIDKALGSDVGQDFLASSFTLLAQVMRSVAIVAGPLLELFARFATVVADVLTVALRNMEPFLRSVGDLLSGFGRSITEAAPGVAAFARDGVGYLAERFGVLLAALEPIGDAVAGTGAEIAAAFSGIGTSTLDAVITAVGELVVALAGVGSDVLVSLSDGLAELVALSPRLIKLFERVAVVLGKALAGAIDAVVPLLEPVLSIMEKLLPVVDLLGTAFVATVKGASDLALALAPLVEEITDVAGEIADQLNPALKQMSEGFTRDTAPAIEEVSRSLGDELGAAFDKVKPGLQGLIDGFLAMGEPAGRLISAVVGLVAALDPLWDIVVKIVAALYAIVPALTAVLTVLFTGMSVVLEKLTPVLRAFSEIISDTLTRAAQELGPTFEDMASKIVPAIENAWKVIEPILKTLEAFLSVIIPVALAAFEFVIGRVFNSIVVIIQVAWEVISGIFEVIILFLQGDFAGAWNRLLEMISGIWDAIANFIVNTVQSIVRFFETSGIADIARAVGRAFEAAYNAVVDWLSNAFDAVARWVANVVDWFGRLPGLIGQVISNAASAMFQFGADLVQGFFNGIIDKAKDIGGFIQRTLIDPVKNALKSAGGFLFGSPSRVMHQYGEWISEGLAIGIGDAESQVVAAAESLTLAASLPGMTPGLTNMGVVGPTPFAPTVTPTAGVGSSTVFGPGAVQVVFQGAVPSEAEAFATGQAVGAGIADVIARRDARVSVGVL